LSILLVTCDPSITGIYTFKHREIILSNFISSASDRKKKKKTKLNNHIATVSMFWKEEKQKELLHI